MSDTPQQPASALGAGGLTLEQVNTWNSAEMAAGRMTAEQAAGVLRECGFEAPAPGAVPATTTAPAATAGVGEAATVSVGKGIEGYLAWEVASGRMSQAEADALTGAGATVATAPSAEDQALSQNLTTEGFPPAAANELRVRQHLLGADEKADAQFQQAEAGLTQMILDAKMPATIANLISGEVAKLAPQWQAMSQGERQLFEAREWAKLESLWGPAADDRLKIAQKFIRELNERHGGKVNELLEKTGANASAVVIAQVALHAERYYAAQARK